MPMSKRIGYNNINYLSNYSQNSAPYSNICAHELASYGTLNLSQINENSARFANGEFHVSAPYITQNLSRINESSVGCISANNCDSVLKFDLNASRIIENLAHAANPCGSFIWKVPSYI